MTKNIGVDDIRPNTYLVDDRRPNMVLVSKEIDRLYTQILTKGMYMGIPPFTYPEQIDVLSPFSP